MNKIKLLYDVFKTMKDKELFNGTISVDAAKGEAKVLSFSNKFNINVATGETKAEISSEFDLEGKKAKHQSNTEFNIKDCKHHKFHQHMHMKHQDIGNHCCEHGGIKAKLSKITFILNILNNLKADGKDEKTVLSLDLKEVIKEIKEQHKDLNNEHQNSCKHHINDHHEHCACIKEFLCSDHDEAILNVYINKNNEVEKIEVDAKGENSLNVLVNLAW